MEFTKQKGGNTMIKELKEMGLTQSMIAREMNTSRQLVNAWFLGTKSASAGTISKLSKAMTTLLGESFPPAKVYMLIERTKKVN